MPQTKRTPLVRVARHSFRNLNEGIELTQLVTKNIEFLPSGEGLWNYDIWRFNGAIMTITDNPVSTNGAVGSIILGNFPAATVLVECASARLTVTRGDTNITATAAMSSNGARSANAGLSARKRRVRKNKAPTTADKCNPETERRCARPEVRIAC